MELVQLAWTWNDHVTLWLPWWLVMVMVVMMMYVAEIGINKAIGLYLSGRLKMKMLTEVTVVARLCPMVMSIILSYFLLFLGRLYHRLLHSLHRCLGVLFDNILFVHFEVMESGFWLELGGRSQDLRLASYLLDWLFRLIIFGLFCSFLSFPLFFTFFDLFLFFQLFNLSF